MGDDTIMQEKKTTNKPEMVGKEQPALTAALFQVKTLCATALMQVRPGEKETVGASIFHLLPGICPTVTCDFVGLRLQSFENPAANGTLSYTARCCMKDGSNIIKSRGSLTVEYGYVTARGACRPF